MPRLQASSFVVVVTLACVACISQTPRPTGVPDYAGRVGLDSHLISSSEPGSAYELARAQSGGFKWIREDFTWNVLEPKRGHFDWTSSDNLMTLAATQDVQVLAIIDYSAAWASSCRDGDTRCPPANPSQFAAYAVAVLNRYGSGGSFWAEHQTLRPDPVTAIEIWNEPFGYWEWSPEPDPSRYAALVRTTAVAVRRVHPDVTILASGDVRQSRTDGTPAPWLESLLAADPELNKVIDAYSVHPYPSPKHRSPTASVGTNLPYDRVTNTHAIDPSLPIWITEIGWSSAPACDQCVTEAVQAKYERDAVAMAIRDWGAYVSKVFVYSWDRSNGTAGDFEGNFGLRRDDDSLKPAYAALSSLIQKGY